MIDADESKAVLNDGKIAVHSLRRAFAELLVSLGANPDEPQEVSRRFGLDKTLTWRIARAVAEEDPWESLQHLPSRPGIRIFASAMSKHGASADRIEMLWKAQETFERFIETHSGDRETLEMMVSVNATKSAEKRMEAFRRDGYQANSALLGVRAQARVSAAIMAPSSTPGMAEISAVSGLVGFCRLRPNVPWAVATQKDWDKDSGLLKPEALRSDPLDPTVSADDAPLLTQFCSQPMPVIRMYREAGGVVHYMLAEGTVGYTAAATVFSGWRRRQPVPLHESYAGECGEHGVNLTTPTEMLVFDLMVHRSIRFPSDPTVRVYSQFPGGPQIPQFDSDAGLLPVPTGLIDLGVGNIESPIPEFPRYHEMIAFALGRLGFAPSDFHVYRYRLRYPPMPALVVIRHPLLPRA